MPNIQNDSSGYNKYLLQAPGEIKCKLKVYRGLGVLRGSKIKRLLTQSCGKPRKQKKKAWTDQSFWLTIKGEWGLQWVRDRFRLRVWASCVPPLTSFKPSQKGCHHTLIGQAECPKLLSLLHQEDCCSTVPLSALGDRLMIGYERGITLYKGYRYMNSGTL